jgi:hypothetical protein
MVDGFARDDLTWSTAGAVHRGRVADEHDLAAAIETALRGADLLVVVADHLASPFVEAAERIDLQPWQPDTSEWSMLLDALAAGANVSEAARQCHMALRSAHRRLAVARQQLGVETTVAAVAAGASVGAHAATAS